MRVPVRHGEGKFVTDDKSLLDEWGDNGQCSRVRGPRLGGTSLSRQKLLLPNIPQSKLEEYRWGGHEPKRFGVRSDAPS